MDTEERRRWENDRRMVRFYESLEGVLKRHDPHEFILAMAGRMRECRENETKWRQTPPFRVVHSVEACCAYARGNSDPVTLNRIFKAMNVYHEHSDPMQHDVLSTNLAHFVLLSYREQIELQYSPARDDFGRAMMLFAPPGSLPRSSKALAEKHRLSPSQWVGLCFLAATAAENSPIGLFPGEAIRDYLHERGLSGAITDEAVRSFLDLSSRTPQEIGRRFREERVKLPRYLHSSIRSALLDTPLIKMGPGADGSESFVLLVRDLMFRHVIEGLYRLMREFDGFSQDIGDTVQTYAERLLTCYDNRVALFGEQDLKPLVSGKSCDFLLELADEIVLLEVKAVGFTKTVLTENSIKDDTSTRRVADGVTQIYATAHDLHMGRLDALGIDKSKPVFGIVVTLGDIPLVNADWYFETFIMTLANPKLSPPIFPSPNLSSRPVAMTVRTLEQLVMLCNGLRLSPLRLHTEKNALPMLAVGDWDTYLSNMIKGNQSAITSLPFMRPQTANLLLSLGVPIDEVEKTVGSRGGEETPRSHGAGYEA